MRGCVSASASWLFLGLGTLVVSLPAGVAHAQVLRPEGPTYQGRLSENGQPASGSFDVRFTPKSGSGFSGSPSEHLGVIVIDGLFTVPDAFRVITNDFYDLLEVAVRPAGTADPYTPLTPLQLISSVPYATNTRGILTDNDGRVGIGAPLNELNARLHVADNTRALALSPEPATGPQEPTNDVVSIGFFDNYPEDGDPADAAIRYSEANGSLSLFTGPLPSLTVGPSTNDGAAYFAGADLQLLGFIPTLSLTPTFPAANNVPLSRIVMGSTVTGGEAAIEWYQNMGRLLFSDPSVPPTQFEDGIYMDLAGGRLGLNDSLIGDPNSTLIVKANGAKIALTDVFSGSSALQFRSSFDAGNANLKFFSGSATLEFDVENPGSAPTGIEMAISPELVSVWSQLLVQPTGLAGLPGVQNSDDIMIMEEDAVLGLYSVDAGVYGSQINLKELGSGGSLNNNWGLLREASSFGSSFLITYGGSANAAANTTLAEIDPAEGSLRLGGAPGTVSDYRLVLPNSATGGGRAVANRWDTYSSARFKTNITTIPNALLTLAQLRGVTFDWKPEHAPQGGPAHDLGFIAEEVAAVLPDAVSMDAEGHAEALDYARLLPIAVEAIKQQQAEIESLRAVLNNLSERLEELETAD